MIPNEYLAYYYGTADVVARQLAAGRTRGQEIAETPGAATSRPSPGTPEAALQAWRETTRARSSTYMAEAGAVRVDGSRAGCRRRRPRGLRRRRAAGRARAPLGRADRDGAERAQPRRRCPFLPADAIVETVCVVTGAGVRTVATAPLPLHARGLIEQMKEVERTTIAAALQGSATLAARALALHPLVPSVAVADRILDAYRAQEPNLRALLA